jgi:hypothetical protein
LDFVSTFWMFVETHTSVRFRAVLHQEIEII